MLDQKYCRTNADVCVVFSEVDTKLLADNLTLISDAYKDGKTTAIDRFSVYQECVGNSRGIECYHTIVDHDVVDLSWPGGDVKYTVIHHMCGNPITYSQVKCFSNGGLYGSDECSWFYPTTQRLFHRYPALMLYITGILLNLLILLVLQWKAHTSVTNFLLKALAVWDMLCLVCKLCELIVLMKNQPFSKSTQIKDAAYIWFKCLHHIKSFWWQRDDKSVRILSPDYVWMYIHNTLSIIFQLASVYQTVVIASFRFIAIYWPFKAEKYLTRKAAGVATVCCLVIGIAAHLPAIIMSSILIDVHLVQGEWFKISGFFSICELTNMYVPAYFSVYDQFNSFFLYYHMIFYHLILFLALPFTLLLGFNAALLYELSRNSTQHNDENKAVTKVIVAVITVFLISYTVKPLYMIDIHWLNGRMMNYCSSISCEAYFTASATILMLPLLNSTINFLLYVGLRQSFRKQFLAMMPGRKEDSLSSIQ